MKEKDPFHLFPANNNKIIRQNDLVQRAIHTGGQKQRRQVLANNLVTSQ